MTGTSGSAPTPGVGVTPPRPYRWVVLAAFMGPSLTAQILWTTFFPTLTNCTVAAFCPTPGSPSQTLFVTLLSLTFPLAYVVLSLPVGAYVDSKGFRKAVLIGAGLLALSGVLRPFSPNFLTLLIFQSIGAAGQPFILNSISKLVRGWFPEAEVATATGLGTLSIYLGLALGLGLTPAIDAPLGVRGMLEVYGLVALVAFIVFLVVAKEGRATRAEVAPSLRQVFRMLGVRNILLLSVLFFVGIGIFNTLATNISSILEERSVPPDMTGLLGGLLIVGGIVGALSMSVIADRYRSIRRPLLLALGASVLLWALLGAVRGTFEEAVVLLVLGFFFMSTLPLALDLSARSVPKASEGAANAMVWEFSQAGGVVLLIALGAVGQTVDWTATLFLAAGLCGFMLALGTRLRTPEAGKPP